MQSSIRRTDILSLSGLRMDGRQANELRNLRIQIGITKDQVGSALVSMGMTVAIATVRGPLACLKRSDERPDRAVLAVYINNTATTSNINDRIEATQFIQHALEATIQLQLFPRSRIEIHVGIVADDGACWCAALNAATLALTDAGIPLLDMCCACTAGVDTTSATIGTNNPYIDLTKREEQSCLLLPCAVLPQRNSIIWAQCQTKIAQENEQLEKLIATAMDGCRAVFEIMQAAVREHAAIKIRALAGKATVSVTS